MVKPIESNYILSSEELENHSKIYAGPGAGKTYFLVENVKNIVTTNDKIVQSKAKKVLCITYTNAAVDEIKRRLERYVDCVEVYTIHGFIIEHIIKPFQEDLISIMKSDFDISVSKKGVISSQIEGLGILHGIDKNEIYSYIQKECGAQLDMCSIKYSKKIMGEVEVDNESFLNFKEDGNEFTPKFKFSTKNIAKEYVLPIKKYIWSEVRKLTHNEILYFGYRILEKNPTALYATRVKFPFIFIDEFQDTNPLQTLLVKMIGEKTTRIIVVGDVAQSIYSFQGAKPSDFNNFCINSDGDNRYSINGNRRSTENIVNFCNFLRKTDDNIVQYSIKTYIDEEEKKSIEAKKIHFLIGESHANNQIISDVIDEGGVVLTRTWADAFKHIQNISEEQLKLLKKIYNNYYNTPIQIRDEILGHNNVKWVRAFRFIFKLWESFESGSFIDMLSALKLYWSIKVQDITPKFIFQFNKLLCEVFDDVDGSSLTVDVIKKFNDFMFGEDYVHCQEILKSDINKISVFDELDRGDFRTSVSLLTWDTSYKLFTEVFSDNSKYMTVHQAKGLEWDKVVVSLLPSFKTNKITLSTLFSHPSLIEETPSDEFVRMYYVACSRAREDLYIYIPSGCDAEEIARNLDSFIQTRGCKLEYEFFIS